MHEIERNAMAWNACYLGIRAVYQAQGHNPSWEEIQKAVGVIREIARNDFTLQDPTYIAQQVDAKSRFATVAFGQMQIRQDQDMAKSIISFQELMENAPRVDSQE